MFINVEDIVLFIIITSLSHTQTVEKRTSRENLKTKANGTVFDNSTTKTQKDTKKKEWKFEDYIKKFEPSTIWEQIDKQKKYNGLILTDQEQSEIMYRAMDPTDELLGLKVENGNPKLAFDQSGRRMYLDGWRPPRNNVSTGTAKERHFDIFHIRHRFYELMKQAIYTTRNKMAGMQNSRKKYSKSALYKMGFLFNRADNAAKTFGKFSFNAYRGCLLSREETLQNLPVYELLSANERQLNLWFNTQLLADLIVENDLIAKEVIKNYSRHRKPKFDATFVD